MTESLYLYIRSVSTSACPLRARPCAERVLSCQGENGLEWRPEEQEEEAIARQASQAE